MMVVMNGENFLEKLNDIQFFILLNKDGNLLIDDFTINSRDWIISGDETNKFISNNNIVFIINVFGLTNCSNWSGLILFMYLWIYCITIGNYNYK